jgi:hypothetical protein
MTREEILDYLSSKGIDLEQGLNPQDFRLDDTIILCDRLAYLSVDMKKQYFRTDPIICTPLKKVSPGILDTFISNYRAWKRKLEEDNRNMRVQKLREAIALYQTRSE